MLIQYLIRKDEFQLREHDVHRHIVDKPSSTSIKITWTASPSATTYYIYRSTSLSGPFTLVGTSNNPFFIDTGLDASKTIYYYEIKASNSSGTSDPTYPTKANAQGGFAVSGSSA